MDCLKFQAILRTRTIIAVQLGSRLSEYRLTELLLEHRSMKNLRMVPSKIYRRTRIEIATNYLNIFYSYLILCLSLFKIISRYF